MPSLCPNTPKCPCNTPTNTKGVGGLCSPLTGFRRIAITEYQAYISKNTGKVHLANSTPKESHFSALYWYAQNAKINTNSRIFIHTQICAKSYPNPTSKPTQRAHRTDSQLAVKNKYKRKAQPEIMIRRSYDIHSYTSL